MAGKAWWKNSHSSHKGKILSFGMFAVAALGSILVMTSPSAAQSVAVCPSDNLTECTRYQKLVEGIDSGDLPTQVASLRAASQDLDPSLRSVIYGKALKSSNLRLRTAAIRTVVAGKESLAVELKLPPRPTPEQQKLYQFAPTLLLTRIKISDNDNMTGFYRNRYLTGSIIRGGLQIGNAECQLLLSGGDEDTLRGVYRCTERTKGVVELDATLYLS